jgi:hypothetical protein
LTDCSKIRTHWKIVIIFDHPRRTLIVGRFQGTAPQFCGPKIRRHGSHGLFQSPMFGSGIRRLDGEAARGGRVARTPPQARHTLAGGFDNRTADTSARFSRG